MERDTTLKYNFLWSKIKQRNTKPTEIIWYVKLARAIIILCVLQFFVTNQVLIVSYPIQIAMTSRLLIVDGKRKNDYIETFLQHWEYVAELKEEECNVGKGKTSFFSPKKTISTKKNFLRRNLKKDKTILHAPFRNQYYYGYRGSLTIPPCSDIVLWYVVDKPMKISGSQLARLKDLIMNYRDGHCRKSTYANSEGHVNRPLQPRNDRNVFHCDESDYSN